MRITVLHSLFGTMHEFVVTESEENLASYTKPSMQDGTETIYWISSEWDYCNKIKYESF